MLKLKKLNWGYFAISGFIGFIIGIFVNILVTPSLEFLSYSSLPLSFLISIFYTCFNIQCAYQKAISILITYTLLGVLFGYIIYKFKNKNDE